MVLKDINFREALNNIVFIRNLDNLMDLKKEYVNNEFVNGYFAYCFWHKDGEIYFRVVDIGFGDDEYFEINSSNTDFMKESYNIPFALEMDSFIKVFSPNVIDDNEAYKGIIEKIELANLVDETLIETRENTELDVFRMIENYDTVKVSFESKRVIFKSKARVKCIAMEGGDFVGQLLEVPFGGFQLSKGDLIKFMVSKNSLNENVLISRQ
ncbi:MAG: hypothetical protein PUK21_03255 [Peptostreptococcaceae bacterium]|nr:hypothetical protein [Peptostreptococcaceae bacterium]MDY5738946.1 hypothetical protein [Anaerovoracaceae bacterium]